MPRDILCICGHDLGRHPPDAQLPFSWPCKACGCTHYRAYQSEWPMYILDGAAREPTMQYVRVHRLHNHRFIVFEGLMER